MADFSDILRQLQDNKKSQDETTDAIESLKQGTLNTIENAEGIAKDQEKSQARIEAGRKAWQTRQENLAKKSEEPSASDVEDKKDRLAQAKRLYQGIVGLKNTFIDTIKGLGDKKVPFVGLDLGTIAKLAVIPLLINFLQSPTWDKIKEFLQNPSWENFGLIFDDMNTSFLALSGIIGLWGLSGIVKTARLLTPMFTALAFVFGSAGLGGILLSIGTVMGYTGAGAIAVAAGTVLFVVGAVYSLIKGFFSAFETFQTSWEETGSLMTAIDAAVQDFVNSAISAIPQLFIDLAAYILNLLGFTEMAETLDEIDVKKSVTDFFDNINEWTIMLLQDIYNWVKINTWDKVFGEDGLISKIPTAEELMKTFTDGWADFKQSMSNIGEHIKSLMPDVQGIFDDAQEKVGKAIENLKAKIPIPDFSNVGQKFADLAAMLDPAATFAKIGDAIASVDFIYGTGWLQDALIGVFGTTEQLTAARYKEQTSESGYTKSGKFAGLHTGGFLGAGQMGLVGERGSEFVMSKSPLQVYSEARTDQLGQAALNRLMGGGSVGGGSPVMATHINNVQNVNRQTTLRPIQDINPSHKIAASSIAI